MKNNLIRLQKHIASCTSYSRRKAEELIEEGRIKVNGKTIIEMGLTIDPKKDKVTLDGKTVCVNANNEKIYIILNKPAGYICTKSDTHDRKTVMDIIPHKNVHPVGRLDKDTEGLLILTNDGEFSYMVTHPKFEHDKEYIAHLKNPLSPSEKEKIEKGIIIEGKKTAPCEISDIKILNGITKCNITIHEGKKRQIRRMFESVNNKVIHLKRIRIGKLLLGTTAKGAYKIITKETAQKALKK